MQLKDSLIAAIRRLTAGNVPSPRMNAELLLMFTLNCERSFLYAHPERELTPEEQGRYEAVLSERSRGMPAQYITGHQEFWGMDFIVTPAVLIPRPETEHVIETVLEVLSGTTTQHTVSLPDRSATHRLRVADIGTGSGCIAVALAKELPTAEIYATDISAAALEIARANAARHQLANRIQFHLGDLMEGLDSPFDIIVSNPPYVGESERDEVQLEVRKYEPCNAVFAGPTGVEVIARLITTANAKLRAGGWLIFEISGAIETQVRQLLENWDQVRIVRDLQGIPRVTVAQKQKLDCKVM